ncbi:MAG: hypothetical protein ABIJ43_03790 [Candidatus Beckwithbacteria bacterium]
MLILGVDPGSARLGWTGSELPVPILYRDDPDECRVSSEPVEVVLEAAC